MENIVSLTCPNCGGKLRITSDLDRFACAYCGQEHIVKRGEGTISIQPVIDGIKEIQIGVDKTASELAIKRINEEISYIIHQKNAARENYYGSQSTEGYIKVFLIIFGLAGAFYVSSTIEFGIFGGIILLLISISIIIIMSRSRNKKNKEILIEWKKYDKKISEKMRELEYHKKIVSKY